MSIIGVILSIIGIVCGIYLIYDGIVNIENRDNILSGILFILLNIFLLFIYLKNLGWI